MPHRSEAARVAAVTTFSGFDPAFCQDAGVRSPRPAMLRPALLAFALSHTLGLLTMALVLRPGMDLLAFSAIERAAYVASHASAWWLGWLPWRLAALGNFWLGITFWRWAKLRDNGAAQRSASLALVWLVIAAVPEQWAEWQLVTTFVAKARADVTAWSRDWALYAGITGVWASLGYTVSVGYWMRGVVALQRRSVMAPRLERALLAAFVLSGVLTLAAALSTGATAGVLFAASSAVNGVAFPALIVWSLVLWRQLARQAIRE
jgi:hypothetical protein